MNKTYSPNEYSSEIYRLRYQGYTDAAIVKCQEAIREFDTNNFFHKILGDLFVQKGDFKSASLAYINQLKLINDTPEYFKHFARFYRLYEKNASKEEFDSFRESIKLEVKNGTIAELIAKRLESLFFSEEFIDGKLLKLIKESNDDQNLPKVKSYFDNNAKNDFVYSMVLWRINDIDNAKCYQTDFYFVSVAERFELYNEALRLIKKIHNRNSKLNPTLIRTMFRICRKIQDYSATEEMFCIDSKFLSSSDFNIQYELVYYFEHKENNVLLDQTLKLMRNSASSSIPIARTLYNFYLKFNKFDEAMEVSKHIRDLETKNKDPKRFNEQFESEQEVWDKLQELVSEQEHNRQMIAMRDLLKGFSHELGQPITNIRYSIQLYMMKSRKGVLHNDATEELLRTILNQTERIGKMLGRFRPIVSSKSVNIKFNVLDRIGQVFDNLSSRLETNNITYKLCGENNVFLLGDPIQFDQVFYNLILNSMQAICDLPNTKGEINVLVSKSEGSIIISFSDNGPGIPKKNAKKIFEPFYTTKDPSAYLDGGEGLGLFIVWNVLKIFNGSIRLDKKYKQGAKFIISIKNKEEDFDEQNFDY